VFPVVGGSQQLNLTLGFAFPGESSRCDKTDLLFDGKTRKTTVRGLHNPDLLG
jgi:hypothetical protein